MSNIWAHGLHTLDEYSQLVTPQATYFLYAFLQEGALGSLNSFVPLPDPTWKKFNRAMLAPPPLATPAEPAPTGPAVNDETALADLPLTTVSDFTWRHYLAGQYTGLDKDRVYRVTAWVKANARASPD